MDNNKQEITTKKVYDIKTGPNSFFLQMFGYFLWMSIFTLWVIPTYYLIYGSWTSKLIIISLLIIQFLIEEKSDAYRNIFTKLGLGNYFEDIKLITETELKQSNSIFCIHPHGILPLGAGLCIISGKTILSNTYVLGTRIVRYLPVSGILARLLGIYGVDKGTFEKLMKKDKNILFVPGGFEEATITDDKQDKLFLKKRKGFIKLGLKYGYSIYPMYTFNENKLFYTINGYEKIGMILNKFKIPGCFFYGKYLVLPRTDIKLYTVVGTPLQLPKIEKPTKDDVGKYHNMYQNLVLDLFNRYKKEYGGSENLEIY
jgi:hypothetical protein